MGYDGAVEVQNDPSIELGWLADATTFADLYLERLVDPLTRSKPLDGMSGLGHPKVHDMLYAAFRRTFPALDVGRLDPYDPLASYADKELWSPLMRRHGHHLQDPALLTILRVDASQPHSASNAMLVPRFKWLLIEVARVREGANQLQPGVGQGLEKEKKEKKKKESGYPDRTLRLVRTRRFCTIEAECGNNNNKRNSSSSSSSSSSSARRRKEEDDGGVDEVLARMGGDSAAGGTEEEQATLRALVEEEFRRQRGIHEAAEAANRFGVQEQAREAVAPAVYRPAAPVLDPQALVDLHTVGLAVLDDVLAPTELAAARQEAEAMQARGMLKQTPQEAAGTRFDAVRWLAEQEEGMSAYPTLTRLVRLLKGLAWEIEEAGGGKAREDGQLRPRLAVPRHCMLAVYQGQGAKYVRHRDNTPHTSSSRSSSSSSNDREVTAILYLNARDYDAQRQGGALRCYLGAAPADEEGATATEVRDVAPVGGRLVVFQSRELLHEVCEVRDPNAQRWALSVWLLGAGVLGRDVGEE